MAGSWKHATTTDGKLLCNEDAVQMLENGGDWYEFAEEAYGIVWWLAYDLASWDKDEALKLIETARQEYASGLKVSPGTDGTLKEKTDGI